NIGLQLFAALEREDDAVACAFDSLVLFAVSDESAFFAEVVTEGVANLVVEKFKELVAGVDEVELAAEIAEHRGIFAADGARAVDRDGPRGEREVEDGIAVEDAGVGEIDIGGAVG